MAAPVCTISRLLNFLASYEEASSTGIVTDTAHRNLQHLIDPTLGEAPIDGYKSLYERLVAIDHGSSREPVPATLYENNFRTLIASTQQLYQRIKALKASYEPSFSAMQADIRGAQEAIRLGSGLAAPIYYLSLESLEAAFTSKKEELSIEERKLIEQSACEFVMVAISERSFMLVHDLLDLIERRAFASSIDDNLMVFENIRLLLDCIPFIQNKTDKTFILDGFKEIATLEERVCALIRAHGGHAYADPGKVHGQLQDYLERMLENSPIEDHERIRFVEELGILTPASKRLAVYLALEKQRNENFVEKGKAVIDLHLVDAEVCKLVLSSLFEDAFTKDDITKHARIERARCVLAINDSICPLSLSELGRLFELVVRKNDPDLLQFIYNLVEDFPDDTIYRSIEIAQSLRCENALAYLNTIKPSRCSVM